MVVYCNPVPDANRLGVSDMDELWLIDAGRLKRVLQRFEQLLLGVGKQEASEAVRTIIKGLKLEPKIDAVPVVRCKDCVHGEYKDEDGWYFCNYSGYDWNKGEHFCSYGERKTDDDNDKN